MQQPQLIQPFVVRLSLVDGDPSLVGVVAERDHAADPRAPCGAQDRSSPAAWLSGWPPLGLAKGGLAAISARDLVDPVAVHLLPAELQLEALAHHAGKKAAH